MFLCVGKTSSLLAAVERNLWADNDCQKTVSSNVSTRPCLPKKKEQRLTAFQTMIQDAFSHVFLMTRMKFAFDLHSTTCQILLIEGNLFCRNEINNNSDEEIFRWLKISRKIDRSLICRQHTERSNSMRYWESSEKKNERTVLYRTDRLWLF